MYNINILPPSSTQLYVLDPINPVTPPIVYIELDQEYLSLIIMVTTDIPVVFIDLGLNTWVTPSQDHNQTIKFIQNTSQTVNN